MSAHLEALADQLDAVAPFDASAIEQVVRGTAEARGVKAGPFMQAVRVSLTGRTVSPGLFETIELLGREESLARIRAGARQAQPA